MLCLLCFIITWRLLFQDPAGVYDLIEVVGNGTYGQVFKVSYSPVGFVQLSSLYFVIGAQHQDW